MAAAAARRPTRRRSAEAAKQHVEELERRLKAEAEAALMRAWDAATAEKDRAVKVARGAADQLREELRKAREESKIAKGSARGARRRLTEGSHRARCTPMRV